MARALVYSAAACGYCVAAKNLLKNRGIDYEEVRVDLEPARREEMMQRTRRTSVPQVFIGDTWIGGFDELAAADRDGRLAALAGAAP